MKLIYITLISYEIHGMSVTNEIGMNSSLAHELL